MALLSSDLRSSITMHVTIYLWLPARGFFFAAQKTWLIPKSPLAFQMIKHLAKQLLVYSSSGSLLTRCTCDCDCAQVEAYPYMLVPGFIHPCVYRSIAFVLQHCALRCAHTSYNRSMLDIIYSWLLQNNRDDAVLICAYLAS